MLRKHYKFLIKKYSDNSLSSCGVKPRPLGHGISISDGQYSDKFLIYRPTSSWCIEKKTNIFPGYKISYRKCLKCLKMRVYKETTMKPDQCKCGSFQYIEEVRYTDFGRNRFMY